MIDNILQPANSIYDVSESNENFSNLVEALTRVNLNHTLSGDKPFTVFTTNDAFEEYLDGISIDMVDEEKLKDIILYRVLSGKVEKSDKVTKFDIMAFNEIIHVIDIVLEPVGNIVEVAKSDDDFSILVEVFIHVNLADILSGDRPFTVFAPTNAAF